MTKVILLVEDNQTDEKLTIRAFKKCAVANEIVVARDGAEALDYLFGTGSYEGRDTSILPAVVLLDLQRWAVILSAGSRPHFSAPAALGLLTEMELDIPFLIVSGTIGEDAAVAAMRAGARDFISKDRLARLGPAVEREIHERTTRE